jgi:hypothetical protein
MVKVFFETPGYAELVAIFSDEDSYYACLPALEKLVEKHGFPRITESIEEMSLQAVDDILKKHGTQGPLRVVGSGFEYTIEREGGVFTSITSSMHTDDDSDEAYNSAVDGLEAMILACAASGMDVSSLSFIQVVHTALQGISNNN